MLSLYSLCKRKSILFPKLCEIFRISDCINLVFRNNFQQLCIQHQASLRKGGGFAEGKDGGRIAELSNIIKLKIRDGSFHRKRSPSLPEGGLFVVKISARPKINHNSALCTLNSALYLHSICTLHFRAIRESPLQL